MPIKIAVLKETSEGERRVALDPSVAERLTKLGATVSVEQNAGATSGFPNDSYFDGCISNTAQQTLDNANIILRVQPPSLEEINQLPDGSLLISFIYPHLNIEIVKRLIEKKMTCLAMELIPRITRAQSMDALSSQATVSGYKATLMAAALAPKLFPMLTTAAGTLRPAKVIIIGAGVAGLQAIATARRLGAQVEAYDIRPDAKEQVESLGAKLIDTGVNAAGEGGYARELTEDEVKQQAEALAKHLAKADAVITTAAIPGRPAPKIITTEMVENMPLSSVIVDLAAETGGNCELTQPGKTITHAGVIINGPLNLPSEAPIHASEMYAKNLLNLLSIMIADGELNIDIEDAVIDGCMVTHQGAVHHKPTRTLLGLGDADQTSEPSEQPTEESTDVEKPVFLSEPDGTPDDLKKINGIGPVLEEKLTNLGIYHFKQVAEFTDEDIEKVDQYLNFKGRITREEWVSQAQNIVGDK